MNSYWLESTNTKDYSKLDNDIETEVSIVGAGMVGVTLAYLLHQQGIKFVLLEKDKVLSSTTANTTAKITSQHGLFYSYLIQNFGKEFAQKYLYSHENAISSIEYIIKSQNIDCDFEKQDAYVYTCSEEKVQEIVTETEMVKALGFQAEFCNEVDLPFKTLGAIKFPNQAQFHPIKYANGLLEKLPADCIYENSKVVDVKKEGQHYKTYTENGSVKSKYVAITTHYPIIDFPGVYFMKMYQDRSYVVAADIKRDLFQGMYISAEEPVTSFRTAKYGDKRLLLVSGSKHKSGDNNSKLDDNYKNIENYIKMLYSKANILYRWNTQDCITLDKVPYIGEYSKLMPNVFVATGFKKWGMTTSYVAAKIISDKILGVDSVYEDIYSSTRVEPIKNIKEIGNMLKQTAHSLVLNKITPPIIKYEDLKIGTGGVVNYKGMKLGIYKKSEDEVYAVKPYCAHLGCELSWNNLEKTWDCPCHGSRYDYEGNLLNEPSKKNLEKVKIEE